MVFNAQTWYVKLLLCHTTSFIFDHCFYFKRSENRKDYVANPIFWLFVRKRKNKIWMANIDQFLKKTYRNCNGWSKLQTLNIVGPKTALRHCAKNRHILIWVLPIYSGFLWAHPLVKSKLCYMCYICNWVPGISTDLNPRESRFL